MINVYVATKTRGFLTSLFETEFNNINFINEKAKVYDTKSKLRIFLFEMVKSRLADYLGIIQRIKVTDEKSNYAFSYNRFLNSKEKYVIYLENPLALVHYSTKRNKTTLGKMKINKYLNDPNLTTIICLSKACYDTLNHFYNLPQNLKVEQYYPLINENNLVNHEVIEAKCKEEIVECLYISSNFNLKGGKDILECFEKLKMNGNNRMKLNIITQLKTLDENSSKIIEENDNINVFDFQFSKKELNKFYSESCILLNPSRQDSFSLVVLEAMKAGNAIISTDLFAIPEMVIEDYNGYLNSPKYRYFSYDNLPNLEVWNNRKETIHSDYIDENMVEFLYNKIVFLEKNRNELKRLSSNSYRKANSGEFCENYIKEQWEKVFT